MKLCLGCKQQKDLSQFNFKNKAKGTRQSQCKDCTREQLKRHYYHNVSYYLNKAKIRNKKERTLKRKYIWNYLRQHPCVDCHEKDIIVLTFDHVEEKTRNIGEMINWGTSLKSIIEEIKKCEVRCANCHLRRTAKQFKWLKNMAS